MLNLLSAVGFSVIFFLQIWNANSECTTATVLTKEKENFSEYIYSGQKINYYKCWKISNPEKQLIRFETTNFGNNCTTAYLRVDVNETGEQFEFCEQNPPKIATAHSDLDVVLFINQSYFNGKDVKFKYEIDFGLKGIKDIEKSRSKAISLLKSKFSSTWDWVENVPKAVIGLYLSGSANFEVGNRGEQQMLEQRDLRISIALLRDSATAEQLSVYVNSLLVNCNNPRRFYGRDLIQRLIDEISEQEDGFVHPITYLALCNANVSWPSKASKDLINVLINTKSDYPILKDIQAFAVMALSCAVNRRSDFYNIPEKLMYLYKIQIYQFKKNQLPNGSFGNVHTTSLITQALLASGEEYKEGWKVRTAVKYLINHINSPNFNFLANYGILPLLNGKTLADIAHVNCSGKSKDQGDSIFDKFDKTIRIQYSLFIGEDKDVLHTMSLKMPQNSTAFAVMKFAETKDPRYKFLWEKVADKMYIYSISNIPNDPEERKLWLLYVGSKNTTKEVFNHINKNPDEIFLKDSDHLVMWYKIGENL